MLLFKTSAARGGHGSNTSVAGRAGQGAGLRLKNTQETVWFEFEIPPIGPCVWTLGPGGAVWVDCGTFGVCVCACMLCWRVWALKFSA